MPFKEPTPGMLAYGLSKTATHSISLNLSNMVTKGELHQDATVSTILPY